jgi:hypothetical protein
MFPVIGWGFLCSFFAYVLILTTAGFTGTQGYFFSFLAFAILSIVTVVAMASSGTSFLSSKESKCINKNVTGQGLRADLNPEEAKETFYYLVHFCRNIFTSIIWGGLSITVIIASAMNIWEKSELPVILVILSGGVVATVLLAVFASFFSEQLTFLPIKSCRKKIAEADGLVPDINFDSIGSKFYFLFLFPILTTVIVLVCVFPFSPNIAILSVIGIVMVLIIDRVLFVYIAKSFFEAETFIKGVAEGKKDIFTTGSVDKEFVSLIDNLNQASDELAESKKEMEQTRKQMENRVDELEKFFDLTVNREIKMVDLKKEIKKLEAKQKDSKKKSIKETKTIKKSSAKTTESKENENKEEL